MQVSVGCNLCHTAIDMDSLLIFIHVFVNKGVLELATDLLVSLHISMLNKTRA